mmetsp:Transcript_37507/g.54919  ORF Transcript_37507/g.54919 Transcript_37507/m.54919 type:complete len:90 (+) Transcript_37507:48-317(+)
MMLCIISMEQGGYAMLGNIMHLTKENVTSVLYFKAVYFIMLAFFLLHLCFKRKTSYFLPFSRKTYFTKLSILLLLASLPIKQKKTQFTH